MPTQMTHQEQQSIDVALRSGGTAVDVIAKINNERMAEGTSLWRAAPCTVSFVALRTHVARPSVVAGGGYAGPTLHLLGLTGF